MRKTILMTAVMAAAFSTSQMALAGASLAEQIAERGKQEANEYPGLQDLCRLDASLGAGGPPESKDDDASKEPGARKVFDNLYFVGNDKVSSWALNTTEGIILIDALNNPEEAKSDITQGLETLGLDPNDIKYLVITHAHGDHYGGQSWIVEQYSPEVMMSQADWDVLADPSQGFENPNWGEPPKKDRVVGDGETLTLGSTTVTFNVTPGHTPGTLSLRFPIQDEGVEHHAILWGGTGFNFGEDEARLRRYSASAARMHQLMEEENFDVFLSNHPQVDGTVLRLKALDARASGEPHPYVTGKETVLKAMDSLTDCSLAQAERVRANR